MTIGKNKKLKNNKDNKTKYLLNIYAYRYFSSITMILVVLIFAGSFFFLLYPKYKAVSSEEEVRSKQTDYLGKMEYLMELSKLKDSYADISQDDKDKINSIISNSNEKEDLFQEMQYLASKNGLALDSLDVVPLDQGYNLENLAENVKRSRLFEDVQVVKTVMKLSNVSYEALINVLKTIEVNLRIMNVNKIDYNPVDGKVEIELLTYELK